MAKVLASTRSNWCQKPRGAKFITFTYSFTSRDWSIIVKYNQQLKFIIELSSLQVRSVKFDRYWQKKLDISVNFGVSPRQRYPWGLVKLQKVKLRLVVMLDEPGLAPHKSQVSGVSRTESRMAESTRDCSPKMAKMVSARKIRVQTDPQTNLFFMVVSLQQVDKIYNLGVFPVWLSYLLIEARNMHWTRKVTYICFIGGLTCTAMTACYWQSSRYLESRHRWDTIKHELNLEQPQNLEKLQSSQIYPFKYVAVKGKLEEGFERVERAKNGRMGFLVVRALSFEGEGGEKQKMAALEGWCEQGYDFQGKQTPTKQFRGILREKEKKDYVHTNFKKKDLQKFKMTTYIDLEKVLPKFGIKQSPLSSNYYLEILRPLDDSEGDCFPYQYSVDNFELPYLTPDKHLSYATFWACCSMVGFFGIFKAIVLK